MEPNLEELRKNYERLDNTKLTRLAIVEAASLRPEALDLLKQIIKERGLSEDLDKGIDAQLKKDDPLAIASYAELLRKLPCPVCGSTDEKLNATMTANVMSFIIITNYKKQVVIACPTCLDKQNNDAMLRSATLGWWGLPWGIIRTVQSLMLNSKMKKQNHLYEANDTLINFVSPRLGIIEVNKNSPEQLGAMIGISR